MQIDGCILYDDEFENLVWAGLQYKPMFKHELMSYKYVSRRGNSHREGKLKRTLKKDLISTRIRLLVGYRLNVTNCENIQLFESKSGMAMGYMRLVSQPTFND